MNNKSNIYHRPRSCSNLNANSYLIAIRKLNDRTEHEKFINDAEWYAFNEYDRFSSLRVSETEIFG